MSAAVLGPASLFLWIAMFAGVELWPLLLRRDTFGARWAGAGVGALAVTLVLGGQWAVMLDGGPYRYAPGLVWWLIFGAALYAAALVRRRGGGRHVLVVGAACAAAAAASFVLAGVAPMWADVGGISPAPMLALWVGAAAGLWIGLREVLPAKLGARGEQVAPAPETAPPG